MSASPTWASSTCRRASSRYGASHSQLYPSAIGPPATATTCRSAAPCWSASMAVVALWTAAVSCQRSTSTCSGSSRWRSPVRVIASAPRASPKWCRSSEMVVWKRPRAYRGRTSGQTAAMSWSLVAPSGVTVRWTSSCRPSERRIRSSVAVSSATRCTAGRPSTVRRSRGGVTSAGCERLSGPWSDQGRGWGSGVRTVVVGVDNGGVLVGGPSVSGVTASAASSSPGRASATVSRTSTVEVVSRTFSRRPCAASGPGTGAASRPGRSSTRRAVSGAVG
jgi:hypothetical protein